MFRSAVALCVVACAVQAQAGDVRFATFNASLNRNSAGQLIADLESPENADPAGAEDAKRIEQIRRVAEIIQRAKPDVLLLNEFDFGFDDPDPYRALDLFRLDFLGVERDRIGVGPASRQDYPHRFVAPVNTGVASGHDLDNNGETDETPGDATYGADCFGYGEYPGKYGMALLSKYPIKKVRTFQKFLWKDMPGNLLENDPSPGKENLAEFYQTNEVRAMRLSSKSHWDITLVIDGVEVHVLASHPTPPAFDGLEDRNGKRNHDEIRFWKDYITNAAYMRDDSGVAGGLPPGAIFVIMGDMNSDPNDGESYKHAIRQLLENPLVDDGEAHRPHNGGGSWADYPVPGQKTNPSHDTADFNNKTVGNLRVDYVLPSVFGLEPVRGGVFWPKPDEPTYGLTGGYKNPDLFAGFPTSDHRLTYLDVRIEKKK